MSGMYMQCIALKIPLLSVARSLFLPTFGCHGNAICSVTNSDSLFNFANPENRVVHIKCLHIHTELKYVQFWHIFVLIWLSWELPLLP